MLWNAHRGHWSEHLRWLSIARGHERRIAAKPDGRSSVPRSPTRVPRAADGRDASRAFPRRLTDWSFESLRWRFLRWEILRSSESEIRLWRGSESQMARSRWPLFPVEERPRNLLFRFDRRRLWHFLLKLKSPNESQSAADRGVSKKSSPMSSWSFGLVLLVTWPERHVPTVPMCTNLVILIYIHSVYIVLLLPVWRNRCCKCLNGHWYVIISKFVRRVLRVLCKFLMLSVRSMIICT